MLVVIKHPNVMRLSGGKTVTFLIDSEAIDNIIDKCSYSEPSSFVELKPASKSLYAFGQTSCLPLLGQFNAVTVQGFSADTTIFVFDGNACNLIKHRYC